MSLLDELSSEFSIGRRDLERFVLTAPARYKIYEIPKRNGRMRTIAQPSAALKSIQRYILRQKLIHLPIHQTAVAYTKRLSIRDNACSHVESRYIIKLDFKNFFPSIVVSDWRRLVRRAKVEQIELADLPIYDKILFWGDGGIKATRLSIGAPSSPFLSNAVLYELDKKIALATEKKSVIYTRYADDITLSGNSLSTLLSAEQQVVKLFTTTNSPKLIFNSEKRGLYGRGYRRMVTGLVITPDNQVSIGRERKRLISAMLHRVALEGLDVLETERLRGLLGFCNSSEPQFIDRMRKKYGSNIIDSVLRASSAS